MDRWQSQPIRCTGGLVLNLDTLTQGIQFPGSATVLQNYEPALEGGYKRILGYAKFDDIEVPGTGPVLGVKVGLDAVYACRFDGTNDYAIYEGQGAGWAKINPTARTGTVLKMRGLSSAILQPSVIFLDGGNPAAKWDGSTWTTINGTGAPTDPKFGATYKNRLVLAGYSSDPSAISISEPNTDIGFDGVGGAQEIPCSDTIVGLKTFRDALYIYCKESIKKLVGTDSSTFQLVDVTTSIGCVSGDTIQELGGDLIFLSPDGFRSTAATQRIDDIDLALLSRQIQPIVREEIRKAFDETKFTGITVAAKSQYRLFINAPGVPAASQIGFLGKLTGRSDDTGNIGYEWATLNGIQPYCGDSSYDNDQEYVILGSNSDGFVFRMEQGTSFDGQPIFSIYRSPEIPFENDSIRKVLQKINIYTQVEGDVNVNLQVYLDRQQVGIPQPSAQQLVQSGSQTTYGTAEYGTSLYGSLTYPVFKKNLVGSGFVFSFQYSSTDTMPSHRIDAFHVIFANKGFR